MTSPRTPGEAITAAAQRIAAQQEATRTLSREVADRRAQDAQEASQPETGERP